MYENEPEVKQLVFYQEDIFQKNEINNLKKAFSFNTEFIDFNSDDGNDLKAKLSVNDYNTKIVFTNKTFGNNYLIGNIEFSKMFQYYFVYCGNTENTEKLKGIANAIQSNFDKLLEEAKIKIIKEDTTEEYLII